MTATHPPVPASGAATPVGAAAIRRRLTSVAIWLLRQRTAQMFAAVRLTTSSRLRWGAALALVLAIAGAYRFPGVSWGFAVDPEGYVPLHRDEPVTCLGAMLGGVPEMKSSMPTERGMMFQCLVLGLVFKPQDLLSATRIGRTYSVLWGLASIVLTALIARRLGGVVAGILAALLLATSGINLATSFWARGQIQNVTLCLASMLLAMKLRLGSKQRALALLFGAAALAGAAIATRWNVALVPMLLACAIARRPVLPRLAAITTGGLFGFFASTGFFWTPDMILANVDMQINNVVSAGTGLGPLVAASAAVVCIVAATGLATFMMAVWFGVARLRRLRRLHFPLEDLTWSGLRSKLDSPAVIIGFPTAITFVLLSRNKVFDARYTDLFAPPLAIAAGLQLAVLWRKRGLRLVVASLVAYQGVYAASTLARYVDDPRERLQPALDRVWQPKGPIYATDYVIATRPFAGHELGPGQRPWDAEWVVASDLYMGMYLTEGGTFSFLPVPPTCRTILFCDGEDLRELFQKMYAGDGWELVHVWKAAAWTPEIKLHHLLMTSKWLFTSDIRLFHKRRPLSMAR